MASMEHPIFSLSTKPDTRIREYERNGIQIAIKPSVDGVATIYDRDILIYCISQLINGMNEGRSISQTVRFKAYDMLVATNRNTAGTGYTQLKAAMERLAGTRISTNIVTGGKEIFRTFGLIESAEVVRETRDGRMQEVEIKLSDWVFNAIESKEVLTLHRDYFRLRKPLERRIYEIARKHVGKKDSWRIGLRTLQKKCGSNSKPREFRRMVKEIAEEDRLHDHMPDYGVFYIEDDDQVEFRSKGTLAVAEPQVTVPLLDPDIYETARALAPGWDVYVIEQEWRNWLREPPKNPEAAFLGFCRTWADRRK
ncbi:replication initiator protein A [Palleronia caenipelagi]|uniref:Replication initiator protein A n=2 Tax=Palleronia caenipelagi TaxID=2489174 RepID=A0A547PMV8_9RHOB|nr:replication initiator protein A [Palleronia caenipelagi]